MELRHLEHFLAVAETGSFSAAAARVYLVQSSLSASLLALERELGEKLFMRGHRGAVLTDAGRALLEPSRAVLRSAAEARDAVAHVRGLLRGTVRIATVYVPRSIDIADTITEFHRDHPDVGVRVSPGDPESMAAWVANGEVDFGIGPRLGRTSLPLRFQSLVSSPLALACPARHRLARARDVELSDLAGESIIELPSTWRSRELFDQLCSDSGLERRIRLEVDYWPRVLALVQQGVGLSYGPPEAMEEYEGVALATLAGAPLWELGILTRDDGLRGAAGRAFLAAYLQRCAQLPARWEW
jgi:DNA-binding transcriptional LysR family regulator